MSHGREKWKSGERSAQTKDDDPDWMYHKPAPDKWEQTLNKWEKKMEYEQQDNDGVAFENQNRTEEWHAHWSGKAMVDGQMYWLSMYDNVSKGGKSYRKLKFKPMENEMPGNERKRDNSSKDDNDIPW